MDFINENKLYTLLAILSLIAQAYTLIKINGAVSIPSNFFALFWSLAVSIPVLLLSQAELDPHGIAFISLCVFFFSLPSFIFRWRKVAKKILPFCYKFDSHFLKLILVLCFVFSFLFSSIQLYLNNFSLFMTPLDIPRQSNQFAVYRNQGLYQYGLIGQISTMVTLAAATIGGLILNTEVKIKRQFLIAFLALLPCVFVMLTQSSKIYFFNGIILFSGGIFAHSILAGTQFSKKKWLGILLFILLIAVLFLLSTFFRLEPGFNALIFLKTINSYLFSEIYAFSDFFCYHIECNKYWQTYAKYDYPIGYFTFKSLYDWLSYSYPLPAGIYAESLNYPAYFESNLYTIFRGLIYDFGVYGTLVFMFLSGLLFNFFYYRLITKEFTPAMLVIYLTFLMYTCMGYLSSVFMSRYLLILIAFIYAILWANHVLYTKKCFDFFDGKAKK